jgi:hypothetical protein
LELVEGRVATALSAVMYAAGLLAATKAVEAHFWTVFISGKAKAIRTPLATKCAARTVSFEATA